jgi:large subunit ribosomal protein L22
VVALIRGKAVGEAMEILAFSPQKAAALVLKVLESAIANAEHNAGADVDTLVVTSARVDEGPTLKRSKPGGKLWTYRVLKRTCHVTIVVSTRT